MNREHKANVSFLTGRVILASRVTAEPLRWLRRLGAPRVGDLHCGCRNPRLTCVQALRLCHCPKRCRGHLDRLTGYAVTGEFECEERLDPMLQG